MSQGVSGLICLKGERQCHENLTQPMITLLFSKYLKASSTSFIHEQTYNFCTRILQLRQVKKSKIWRKLISKKFGAGSSAGSHQGETFCLQLPGLRVSFYNTLQTYCSHSATYRYTVYSTLLQCTWVMGQLLQHYTDLHCTAHTWIHTGIWRTWVMFQLLLQSTDLQHTLGYILTGKQCTLQCTWVMGQPLQHSSDLLLTLGYSLYTRLTAYSAIYRFTVYLNHGSAFTTLYRLWLYTGTMYMVKCTRAAKR
jgi:hypothetical protein